MSNRYQQTFYKAHSLNTFVNKKFLSFSKGIVITNFSQKKRGKECKKIFLHSKCPRNMVEIDFKLYFTGVHNRKRV